ncbi:transposase [Streptomyces zaomyceticus]
MIAVDPAYTSQTCNRCGHVDAKNRRTRDQCTCTRCGHATHASIGVSKERPSPRAGGAVDLRHLRGAGEGTILTRAASRVLAG